MTRFAKLAVAVLAIVLISASVSDAACCGGRILRGVRGVVCGVRGVVCRPVQRIHARRVARGVAIFEAPNASAAPCNCAPCTCESCAGGCSTATTFAAPAEITWPVAQPAYATDVVSGPQEIERQVIRIRRPAVQTMRMQCSGGVCRLVP